MDETTPTQQDLRTASTDALFEPLRHDLLTLRQELLLKGLEPIVLSILLCIDRQLRRSPRLYAWLERH